jgi:hypothetical protein
MIGFEVEFVFRDLRKRSLCAKQCNRCGLAMCDSFYPVLGHRTDDSTQLIPNFALASSIQLETNFTLYSSHFVLLQMLRLFRTKQLAHFCHSINNNSLFSYLSA